MELGKLRSVPSAFLLFVWSLFSPSEGREVLAQEAPATVPERLSLNVDHLVWTETGSPAALGHQVHSSNFQAWTLLLLQLG